MFNDFYDGYCEIYTCDILERCEECVKDMPNVHFYNVDAGSKESLYKLKEELGVEIEIISKIGVVSDYYNLIHRHNINNYFFKH